MRIRAHVIESGKIVNTIIVGALTGTQIDADLVGGSIGWDWDGTTATPPAAVVVVPEEVAKWAAEVALIEDDLLDSVNAAIDAITPIKDRKKTRAMWDKRDTIRRDSSFIETLKTEVPLTDTEVDDLFIAAKAIELSS